VKFRRPTHPLICGKYRHDSLPCRLVIASISRISGAAAPVTTGLRGLVFSLRVPSQKWWNFGVV
jgi:hypothetical protein